MLGIGAVVLATREPTRGHVPEATSAAVGPVAVDADELHGKLDAVKHPVYWLGAPPPERKLELTLTDVDLSPGNVYIRYLGGQDRIGGEFPATTVGTYPIPDAEQGLRKSARKGGHVRVLSGRSVLTTVSGLNCYVVFDDEPDLQIEVYDPRKGRAERLVVRGAVRPV